MGALARGLTSFGGAYLSGKAAADEAALKKGEISEAKDYYAGFRNKPAPYTLPAENGAPSLALNIVDPVTGNPVMTTAPRSMQEQRDYAAEARFSDNPMIRSMADSLEARATPKIENVGARGAMDTNPDSPTYGKIIGGGMPVGAYGGSKELMACISPDGPVYQAGTLSGNPVAMAAGLAACNQLLTPNFYCQLDHKTNHFIKKLTDHATQNNYNVTFPRIGSIFWIAFSKENIKRADQIDPETMKNFKLLHAVLLENGIYMGPSGYEVGFVSAAHTTEVLNEAAEKICWALDKVFSES
jgi:glutamate-1-semialdehyde aminotransferase